MTEEPSTSEDQGIFGTAMSSGGLAGYASARFGIAAQSIREKRRLKSLTNPKGYLEERRDAIKTIVSDPVDKEFKIWYDYWIKQGLDLDTAKALATRDTAPIVRQREAMLDQAFPLDLVGTATGKTMLNNFYGAGAELSGMNFGGFGMGSGGSGSRRKSSKRSTKRKSRKH